MITKLEYSQLFGNYISIMFYGGGHYCGMYNSDDQKLYISKYVSNEKSESLILEMIALLNLNNLNIKNIK